MLLQTFYNDDIIIHDDRDSLDYSSSPSSSSS